MKNIIKQKTRYLYIIIMISIITIILPFKVAAQSNKLHIIPEIKKQEGGEAVESKIKTIRTHKEGSTVIDRYNIQAEKIEQDKDIGEAFKTGIFNWNIFIQYIVYLMKFLSQLGLLIGGIMILYAGYLYAGVIFGIGDVSKAKNSIKYTVIGILVVIFSYAIMKGLTSAFL